MVKEAKHITYEELAADLPGVLDSLVSLDSAVVVKRGHAQYRIERTEQAEGLPPAGDPEEVRKMLQRTAGAFKGIDKAGFMRDLRVGRQQSSSGRPA
jgi:hypothetical protein